jgi:hypothetical protein
VAIIGIVIGVVEATKKKGMMFDILFSWKVSESSFQKS